MSQFVPAGVPKTAAPSQATDLASSIISRDPSLPLQQDERKLLDRLLGEPSALPQAFWAAILDKMLTDLPSQIPIDQLQGWTASRLLSTGLPESPKDGDQVILVDDVNDPTYVWQLRYVSHKTDNKWVFVGGGPKVVEVNVEQSTTSGVYTNLATIGPSFTVPLAGSYLITIGAFFFNTNTANSAFMSYNIGALAAVDADSVQITYPNATVAANTRTYLNRTRIKNLSAGDTLTCKYRVTGGTGDFTNRILSVLPIALSA